MRVHLVDGTYELFRAHYSPRPDRVDPDGRDVKATVGLVSSLLAMLDTEDVTHVAVAFDNPIRSFRNDLFEGYKDESGVPEELLAQFDRVEEAVAALGLVVWSMDEYEADDALATAAARYADRVDQVVICTPDKDLGQCLRGDRVVQLDRRNDVLTDEEAFRDRRGFAPASIPDYLALVGDSADGIPGVPGFGDKTVSTLLSRYPHLEDIPRLGARWEVSVRGAERLAGVLHEHMEEALRYRRLATLVTDIPIDEALDDLRWGGVPRARFEAWCTEVGSEALRDRPSRWIG